MRLAVPDLISNSYFPAIAAVELGCFREAGLDVSLELLFPVTRTMAALRERELDLVAGAAHVVPSAFPNWRGARLLGALAQRMYWLLVVRADLPGTRGDLSILPGLRIGAAPGPDAGLVRLLQDAGVHGVQVGPIPGTDEPGVSFGVTAARALEAGQLDGFWANAMGAEVAVRRGVGRVVLDVRRGEAPPASLTYTFPGLVSRDDLPEEQARAAYRALVQAQDLLRQDPSRATAVGEKLFPPMEAGLIAELIRRDLPYYEPSITRQAFAELNAFAEVAQPLAYEQVVLNDAQA
jgi:ABC-type nitrate/sulfonate/bicarbonate transport system substrate-binding protein